jgi:hypothetical protein
VISDEGVLAGPLSSRPLGIVSDNQNMKMFKTNILEVTSGMAGCLLSSLLVPNLVNSPYAIPIMLFSFLSSVFLVRLIKKDGKGFSQIGLLSMAWPMFCILISPVVFIAIILPFAGLLISLYAAIRSRIMDCKKIDLVAIPYSIVWMILFGAHVFPIGEELLELA